MPHRSPPAAMSAAPTPCMQTLGHGHRYPRLQVRRRIQADHRSLPFLPQRAQDSRQAGSQVDVARQLRSRLPRRSERTSEAVAAAGAVPPALQPLHQSPLRARLPHAGHLQDGRRDCRHGLSPLHRLPFLHGRLPLRRSFVQLRGPAQVPVQIRCRIPPSPPA